MHSASGGKAPDPLGPSPHTPIKFIPYFASALLATLSVGDCCVGQNADVAVTLKNQIAELEEEKGNLQLQLLDTDESKTGL